MRKTHKDLLAEARSAVPEVTPEQVRDRLDAGGVTLIDVRDDDEWRQGHVHGARHVSRGMLEFQIGDVAPDPASELILYCAAGSRSLLAARSLQVLGYERVSSMAGGVRAWQAAGFALQKDVELSADQMERYSRHLVLPQVGREGQIKLLESSILVVGVGGLGSPAALYLAAAGVGRLGLVDGDDVELSNLQRQVLHGTRDIGRPKVESAAETLADINPDTTVQLHGTRLSRENVWDLVSDHDVVLQCSDNFETRYLVNDAAYFAGKPVVDASIFRFEGQATVLHPAAGGPCYRCIFPEQPGGSFAPT